MASYHFSAQIIKRGCKKFGNRSAVACAAYRAGSKLKDEKNKTVFDYSRRKGVVHSEILLPEDAAPRLADRQELWNEVEQKEKRKDAQLAREINVALPHELSPEERKEFLMAFVQDQFVSKGMIADVAIHAPVKEHGDHPCNHHAHIMLTLRQPHKAGLYRTKTREWNSRDQMKVWREEWANYQNRALERAGRTERVSHETLDKQREDALARGDKEQAEHLNRTPEIHVGVRARHMEQRRLKDRPAPSYTDQIMQHLKAEARAHSRRQWKAKNQMYQQRMRQTDKNLGVLHMFDGNKYNQGGYGLSKEYKRFMQIRAGHNAKIIAGNMARAEARREELQRRQVRLQQKRLYYMKHPNKAHAERRLGLLGLLLGDLAEALMQAVGAESRYNNRFFDFNTRLFTPVRQNMFAMDRGRGGGRERILQ